MQQSNGPDQNPSPQHQPLHHQQQQWVPHMQQQQWMAAMQYPAAAMAMMQQQMMMYPQQQHPHYMGYYQQQHQQYQNKQQQYHQKQQKQQQQQGSKDCCSWDGVECDRDSGHVIGLDLSSSCLYGSIDSNSSLFHLVHLRRLNLADNDFNNSEIPSEIRNLPRLFDLNLSFSVFSGQIPAEILELSKLVSIDLGWNHLKLQKPGLQHLVEALTNLEVLHLNGVDISAKVPQIMANLSSLSSLFLRDCGLQGEFPMGIFQLPSLRFLSIRFNPYLTGYLPEFHWGSHLETLMLAGTNFSGQLPESIGNLKSLKEFDVAECYFSGAIPSSLGNLTKLNSLDLSYNNFTPGTLDWLGNLTKLNLLSLTQTNSYSNIPSTIRNFTQLTYLDLEDNELTGQIPSWIGNHTQLIKLFLSGNKMRGPIPGSIYRLQNLEHLSL